MRLFAWSPTNGRHLQNYKRHSNILREQFRTVCGLTNTAFWHFWPGPSAAESKVLWQVLQEPPLRRKCENGGRLLPASADFSRAHASTFVILFQCNFQCQFWKNNLLHFVKTRKLKLCPCLNWFSIALWLREYVATSLGECQTTKMPDQKFHLDCTLANFVDICELVRSFSQFAWRYCCCTCTTCCYPPLIGQRSTGLACHWSSSGAGSLGWGQWHKAEKHLHWQTN